MALPDEVRTYMEDLSDAELMRQLHELRPDFFPDPELPDGAMSMDELVAALAEVMDGMSAKWDKVGRLAVLFGACVHASGLTKAEARRALTRFEGATDWQKAEKPLPGETVQ